MDRATNILGCFVVGVSIVGGLWAMLQVGIWIGRTDVKTLKAAGRDMHAEYIEAYQQAPPAMTIEERQAKFAPEPKPIIDMNRIVQIESSGNANAVGTSGERGLCQIMPVTWSDVTREMGVEWSFDEAWDPKKNLAVADWYLNVTLPRYLKHYDVPDTSSARVAAFNYGIGNINRLHGEHGGYWLMHTPECVQGYVMRYHRAVPQRDYVATYKKAEKLR